MSLVFQTDTHKIELDRNSVQDQVFQLISESLTQSGQLDGMLRTMLKSVAELLMMKLGIKAPEGVDKIEFLAAYVLQMGLDKIDGQTLQVQAKVTDLAAKEVSMNG